MFPLFLAWCIPTSPFIQLNDFDTCIYIAVSVCPTRINCSTLYATPVGPHGIPERLRRKHYVYFENTTSSFRICGICRYTVVGATAIALKAVGRKRSAAESTRIGHRSMLLSRPETTVVINQVHVYVKPSPRYQLSYNIATSVC